MAKHHTPDEIRPPFANYVHGVEVAPGARLLFCSGQLGVTPTDEVPEAVADQARLCYENIGAILATAGMGYGDIVRISTFVTAPDYLAPVMAVRDAFVADPPPASTLMVVAGFARPAFKVEVEVIAAREGA